MDDQMNELRQMVLLLMRNQNVRSNTNDNEGMFQTKLPSTSHVKSKDNNENVLQTKLPFSSNVKSKGNTKRIHQTKLPSSSNAQSKVSMECDKCQLIDWTGTNEVVASGRIALVEPTTILHHVPTWSSCHDGMGRFFGESRSILMETYIRHVDNEGCFWQFSCMAY
ncbi:hypothetical protein Scep_019543 [Stephania cephalantha]|uniref:Uncharacterized protein n=1 Tax=Stephania cephalantha TaxID=152367 RepID=A0AAP0IAV2_9MAGN